ncbi:MAG: phosphoglucomutase [Cryomorphaceae bacterium]|nr:phosphoglucomutase [Cryomorphaceae bacterium]
MKNIIDPVAQRNADIWLTSNMAQSDKLIIQNWMDNDPELFNNAFYKNLEFGTGGLRGVMQLGSNGINKYTLGLASQGLSDYLSRENKKKLKIAIAYDSRLRSQEFASEIAKVFSANNIDVFIFSELRPTPILSFSVRDLCCDAGIVITASHNPKEYNGFKVYLSDGGQLIPPHDKEIIQQIQNTQISDIKWSGGTGLIKEIKDEIDKKYLEKIKNLSFRDQSHSDLKIIFTALHGTSITLLPKALKNLGFQHVEIIESQAIPDGNFPTVTSPNPEEQEALSIAIKRSKEINADIVIGCDPDADRVGIAVKNNFDEIILLNGNQTAAVLFNFVLNQRQSQGSLPSNAFTASTIVTSTILDNIAKSYNIDNLITLTGFKWIADLINKNDEKEFIIGGEESYGYLISDFVRDKDAISASVLLAEAASFFKESGSSFYEELLKLYSKFGSHLDSLLSIVKKGKKGDEEIREIMHNLRSKTPKKLGSYKVKKILDYQLGQAKNIISGELTEIKLPKSNVLQFIMENNDRITVRPSGTEPKIKYYFNVIGEPVNLHDKNSFNIIAEKLNERIENYKISISNF